MPTNLSLTLPPGFSLPHAVCSYGYFILAPNRWDPPTRTLARPLRDGDGRVIRCRISQSKSRLRIACHRAVARRHHATLKAQVARILRLDEPAERFTHWHRLNTKARRARFDRLYRSPTLFEDMVKTITGCNVSWPNTINMNRLLVEHVGSAGDFPTPGELAAWTPARLKKMCKVGYRAERIIELARLVDRGKLDPAALEDESLATDALYDRIRALNGFGDYATNNVLQCLGRYERLPIDSETIRHFRQHHGANGDAKALTDKARTFYDRYAPFQFLAYWFELWGSYEQRFGTSHGWTEGDYDQFTASRLK